MIILKKGGTQVNTALKHNTSNPLFQHYHKNVAGRSRIMSMPVCPKCERAGFRDKGWMEKKIMRCPHCAYNGPATHVLSAYIDEGLYK